MCGLELVIGVPVLFCSQLLKLFIVLLLIVYQNIIIFLRLILNLTRSYTTNFRVSSQISNVIVNRMTFLKRVQSSGLFYVFQTSWEFWENGLHSSYKLIILTTKLIVEIIFKLGLGLKQWSPSIKTMYTPLVIKLYFAP